MATEEQHAVAFIAKLNLLGAKAFDVDEVPTKTPDYYTEVSVVRIVGGIDRDGGPGVRRYRATTRVIARTVTNARKQLEAVSGVERQVLTVAGDTTTPVKWETADPIGPDGDEHDDWHSGLTYWTWAL